ncbi:TonB-dependent siderophore receptor [Massilia sp. CF038]|uniref:TonB-dependent receptor plug domain-containing protein n=1 Tax=Massilia sp. CF038 TaxID=1881045 RepID=UPI001E494B6F|nr:TonB-dependent receptor [Massilia sp. CF038]
MSSLANAAPPEAPIPTVEVSGSADTRRDDVNGKLSVSRSEISRYGDNNLSGVLRRQSGVSVSNGTVSMRGLGAGYTLILVNGEPVPAGFSIDSIAPALVDRIDILRTASAEFGTQAIAGTINIILKKAGGAAQRDASATTGLRPGQGDPAASLRLADQYGAMAWSLGTDLSRTVTDYAAWIDDTGSGATPDRRVTRDLGARTITRFGLTPNLSWKLDKGDSLAWQTQLERSRDDALGSANESLIAGAPTSYPENNFAIHSTIATMRSNVTWTHQMEEGAKLLVKAGVNRNKRENAYVFRGFGASTLVRAVDSDAIDNSVTLSGKYLAQLGQGHSLGIGWDGGRTQRTEQRLQNDNTAEGVPLGVLDENYRATVGRLALFAQDEWAVTPRLQAYLGLRWEALRTDIIGRTQPATGVHASVPSPILQLLWKLPETERDQVRLALSRTYKAPTSRQLVPRRYTTNNGNSPTNPDSRGNPDLRPELAWGLETGYEHYFGKNGMVSIAAYTRRIDDVTVQNLYLDERGWISTPFNNGRARASGIELETKLPLAASLDLRANAARNWSAVDAIPGPDNRLADQTRATLNIGVDWRADPAWTLSANLNARFDGAVQVTPQLRTYRGPERNLDMAAVWKMNGSSQCRLMVTNALHQDRLYNEQYSDNARRSVSDSRTLVRLAIEVKL